MKKTSLKQILLTIVNASNTWLTKGELALEAEREGFLGETAGRCLRQLTEEGLIKVDYYKSKRNIDLARYARLETPPPLPSKPTILLEEVNGQMVAKML